MIPKLPTSSLQATSPLESKETTKSTSMDVSTTALLPLQEFSSAHHLTDQLKSEPTPPTSKNQSELQLTFKNQSEPILTFKNPSETPHTFKNLPQSSDQHQLLLPKNRTSFAADAAGS